MPRFIYHCSFYFYHFLKLLFTVIPNFRRLFVPIKDGNIKKKLKKLELLSRFKQYPIKIIQD